MAVKKEIRKYCKRCGRYRSITKLFVRHNHGRTWYFCIDNNCLNAFALGLTGADDTK